jgi:putative serine/threonine protein kinase
MKQMLRETTKVESERGEAIVVSPRDLNRKEHGALICYPGTDLSTFRSRVSQLKSLGVESLILEGESKVGRFGIVGKGCVSTVVMARLRTEREAVALKIRRADANRPDMSRDFELQRFANSFGVGPGAIAVSKDLFAMEYIDSIKLGRWFQQLKTRSSKKFLRALIRNSLEQCYLLDAHGLDHGELSNPSKHVLIRNNSERVQTAIIDYESASRDRRASNVTSVAQFFFLGGWQSAKVRKILTGDRNDSASAREDLVSQLRDYKHEPSRESLEKILSLMKC